MNLAELADLVRTEGGVPGEVRLLNNVDTDATDLMVIGEAPGPTEEKQGRPFVGKAGRVLDEMMLEANIPAFYITNVCKHFPGYTKLKKIAKPSKVEKERWWPLLEEEIKLVKPTQILLMGEHAAKPYFFPGNWRMRDMVGVKEEKDGITYRVLYHPASFLYSQGTAANTRHMNKQRRVLADVLGEEEVDYAYEVMEPHTYEGSLVIDVETEGGTDPRTANITEWSSLEGGGERRNSLSSGIHATLCFDRSLRPPRPTTAIFHNSLFDYPLLAKQDPQWLSVTDIHDTMIMAYTLGYEDLSLKGLSNQLFGVKVYDYKNKEECGKEVYNAQDVFLTKRLYDFLSPQLDGTAYDTDRKLIPILTWASIFSGYEIDQKRLAVVVSDYEAEKAELESIFEGWFPGINMGSPAQLLQVLPVADTKAETLKALDTPEAHVVIRWRWLRDNLVKYLYPHQHKDRLSGLYRLTLASGDEKDDADEGGTTTGRLSSYAPNMQNLDPTIQQCLRAPAKHDLLRADYGQIELRCIAQITGDKRMIKELKAGLNFHEESAKMLGLDYKVGKTWNFARWYGAEAPKLATVTGRSVTDCLEMMRIQDEVYPGQKAWGEGHWATVQATGFSIAPDPFRHRRKIHLFNEAEARRQALNHPAQSLAVYITKAAMSEIGYEPDTLEFINQVHDDLHYFIPKGDKKRQDRVREAMMEVGNDCLPSVGIDVDVKTERYWTPKE